MKDYQMIEDKAQRTLRIRVDGLLNSLPVDDVGLTEWVYFTASHLREVYKKELQEECWQRGYKSGYNDAAKDKGNHLEDQKKSD